MDLTHAEIAAIAYRFWKDRGCPEGDPDADWFRAERVLRGEISIIQPEPAVRTDPPVGTKPTDYLEVETVEVENPEVIENNEPDWAALEREKEKKPTFVESVERGAKKLGHDVAGVFRGDK